MRAVLGGALAAILASSLGCSLTIDPESVKRPTGGPALALSTTALSFTAVAGGASPAAQPVTVSNAGSGTLATPAIDVAYVSGTGWLAVTPAGPAGGPWALSVQPTLGSLGAGSYSATITVTCAGAGGSPAAIAVTFTVSAAPPALAVSPGSLSFSATEGGASPAPQALAISSSNASPLAAAPSVAVTAGGSWLSVGTPAASGGGYTVQVSASVASLAAGSYDGQLTVTSAGATGSPATVSVALVVGSATQPTLSLAPTALTFTATQGDADPLSAVTVTNVGAGTLATPVAGAPTYGAGASGWLAISAATGPSNGPYGLAVQAHLGPLPPGTYTATVTLSAPGASNAPQLQVTLVIAARPRLHLSTAALTFTRTANAAPAAQAVTVTNAGGGTLAAPVASGYPAWLAVGTPSPGAGGSYTISVQPADTQPPGTYTGNVQVSSAGALDSPASFSVTYAVPGILLAPATTAAAPLAFSATAGSGATSSQDVTVSNSGGGTLPTPTATVTSGSPWLTAGPVTSPAANTYKVPVQVAVGALGAGSYAGAVEVAAAGAKNAPQTIHVSLAVSPAAQPVMTVTPSPLPRFAVRRGGAGQSQTLTVTNTGSGILDAPTAAVTSSSYWLSVGTPTGDPGGPYAILVTVIPGSMAPGSSYQGTVRVTAPAGATPASVDVDVWVDVLSPALGGCIASSTHQVCAGAVSEGAAESVASAGHAVRHGRVEAGGAARIQSATHQIARGAALPAAATQ